jgi:hypothetical protein
MVLMMMMMMVVVVVVAGYQILSVLQSIMSHTILTGATVYYDRIAAHQAQPREF